MFEKNSNDLKKKFAGDMLFNIIATAIPIIILQLIAYPLIGQKLPEESYGLMVTIYAMMQLVSGTLGTGLNNVKLIKDEAYKANGIEGDFNIILIAYGFIVAAVMFFGTWYYQGYIDITSVVFIICTAVLSLINSYIEVEYRLNLTFKKIFIASLLYSAGYLIGILLFYFFLRWELVFLFGQIICFLYNLKNTGQLGEKVKMTRFLKKTLADTIFIDIAGFCSRAISYADKMLLLPIVGGASVAVYYTATLIGKIILLGLNPINSVILSYINKRSSVSGKTFKLYLLCGICICTIGYGVCIFISRPVLGLLFPQWVDEAMCYVPITTLNLCIITLCNFLTPFTIKFCDMHWQFTINFITMAVYILASMILLNQFGLVGFCWGITISYFLKLILTLTIYLKKRKERS